MKNMQVSHHMEEVKYRQPLQAPLWVTIKKMFVVTHIISDKSLRIGKKQLSIIT
jgi:hypothetical protein